MQKNVNNIWGSILKLTRKSKSHGRTAILAHIPIFRSLSRRELGRVCDLVHDRRYETGEPLFELGQPGAAFFVIQEGEIEIIIPKADGSPVKLAAIGEGGSVGELALLDDSPRSASAIATKKTLALAFFREDLHSLLNAEPVIASKIYKALSTVIGERLKATNDQLQQLKSEKGLPS